MFGRRLREDSQENARWGRLLLHALATAGVPFRLGNRDAEHDAPVHNERFNFNDKAIATGAAVLLSVALTRMSN